MARRSARFWIGLLSWLLMQLGWLNGVPAAQAEPHPKAVSCVDMKAMDEPARVEPHRSPEQPACCVHDAASDAALIGEATLLPPTRDVPRQPFAPWRQQLLAGTIKGPSPPPPKFRIA
jgi:hypothetical protein